MNQLLLRIHERETEYWKIVRILIMKTDTQNFKGYKAGNNTSPLQKVIRRINKCRGLLTFSPNWQILVFAWSRHTHTCTRQQVFVKSIMNMYFKQTIYVTHFHKCELLVWWRYLCCVAVCACVDNTSDVLDREQFVSTTDLGWLLYVSTILFQ